jgi:hypothetical protein
MATLTKGKTFTNGELVTPQKLHELVDLGTVSGIVNADISASAAIADSKLAQITTANKVAQSAVTNLTTDLAGKAAASHTHTIANVTGLQAALDGKQAAGSYAPATGIAPSAITGTAVVTTDSRLSDARTPTSHNHDASNITSGTLANARTTATSDNTVNAIVARDASGNFSAGRITANSFRARGGQPGSAGISNNGFSFEAPGDNDSGMFSSADGQLEFFVNSTEKARFTNTDFLIGTTQEIHPPSGVTDGILFGHFDPRIIVSRNNLPSMECRRRSSNGEIVNFYRDTTKVGNISVTSTSTAYNTSSDYRLKTNLEPLTAAVARLLQIPVHRFNWLADPNGSKVDGFLAHEAQAIVPESVTGHKDEVDAEGKPVHQGIDQSKLVPLLVAAVQELAARVAALEAR